MSIQRTSTFQTYGIDPSFDDKIKARARTCTYYLLENVIVELVHTWSLTVSSSEHTMQVRVS